MPPKKSFLWKKLILQMTSHKESEHKATKEKEATRLLSDLHFQSMGTFRPTDPIMGMGSVLCIASSNNSLCYGLVR